MFGQLADTDGAQGVKTLIETHDAWVNNAAVLSEITAAMRAQLARTQRAESVTRRILRQRDVLARLAVGLPKRARSAG
jgi:hypothetical protein